MDATKPKLAVWKFASCDGCQLSILDCEDELLLLASLIDIAYFPEATRAVVEGPYTLSLVEGSITTAHDEARVQEIREQSDIVVSIGACATAGGIQALKNFADVNDFISTVYAHPEYISSLKNSTAIADHIRVDYELRGCPVSKQQLLELIGALLNNRKPQLHTGSVCEECKARGNPCVMVAHGTPCLGPITQAGCGAICPAYNRGCYGCFGTKEAANVPALSEQFKTMGMDTEQIVRIYRTFNAADDVLIQESQYLLNTLSETDSE